MSDNCFNQDIRCSPYGAPVVLEQDWKRMKALLLYTEFPDSFWSFKHALKFIRKKPRCGRSVN